jgi:hypothetical protein
LWLPLQTESQGQMRDKIRKRVRAKRIHKKQEELRDQETVEFFAQLGDEARRKNYEITTYTTESEGWKEQ